MKIDRRYTKKGTDVFSTVQWTKRTSKIANLDGSVVFEMNDAEVPEGWSQLATDIMVSKYFRKAGVPQTGGDGAVLKDEDGRVVTGPERSAKQVIHRLAGCWCHWGEEHGYFDTAEDAMAFYDELCHMLLHQMAAPNSPQWFNTGLNWAYDINGPAQGHYYTDPTTGATRPAEDAYSHPQPHACFIQSVQDDLVSPGGIMDLWVREARLFKYGSGTGTNFSALRGECEPLSGGGKSSGLMSWLKIGDRAAGAIKSGGTTRRAAKMVCLDLDHPDIEQFVNWKVREEIKVAALVEGLKHLPAEQKETAKKLGMELDYDFNGEAYLTVSGQNSNNSVRIPNSFFKAIDTDGQWDLIRRTDGKLGKSVSARSLWDQIGYAAWRCADPGVQYDTTINQWHTCPESGRINASNPCSEYMFLDNTACNLASLNMLKFYDAKRRTFDWAGYEHAVNIWTIVLEVSVLMAQFPSKEIAELSYQFRTLGLGFANMGAMLMQAGVPYDSDRGRAICGTLSAIMTGRSYSTSAQLAEQLGAFPGYQKNRKHMLRVIRNHRRAAYGVPRDLELTDTHDLGDYEGLEIKPVPIDADAMDSGEDHIGKFANGRELVDRARINWDSALKLGQEHGFRNAQTTVIAPTGTIGLLMDCDTTGVEPDFALVKFKKLAGGGYFKIANQSLKSALEALGYQKQQVRDILIYVMGALHLDVPMPAAGGESGGESGGGLSIEAGKTFDRFLRDHGLTDTDLKKIIDALPTVFELTHAFNAWTLGESAIERLGLTDQADKPGFDLLIALGLTKAQVTALNCLICGTQTVEGAPHLRDEHLAVFDCASTCGPTGKRLIAAGGHIQMMAAAQPFISGAISKTINLPGSADIQDIKDAYRRSWELGLKANALYRDGCKLSQVLSNKADADDGIEDEEAIEAAREEVTSEVAALAEVASAAVSSASATTPQPAPDRAPVEKIIERIVERPLRRRLPDTRMGKTHKFNVAGHEGYLTVGLYVDGTPGELFITMAKEGSTIGGLMDSLGTAISVALQYGVPIESLVNKFTHQRFEPAGITHNPEIPFAKSLVDYIFRWLGMEFIPGYRAANAPARSKPEPKQPDLAAAEGIEAGNGNAPANGNGGVQPVIQPAPLAAVVPAVVPVAAATSAGAQTLTESQRSALFSAMSQMQSDAPACDACGTITVRNGTCYKCLNCGASMGCS